MKNTFLSAVAFVALLLANCFGSTAMAQQVDPNTQIHWATPILGQGPVSVFYNGVVQADQYTGADMCQKIGNASVAAINAAGGRPALVDATHFSGVQACNYNMFANLPGAGNTTSNLAITFGAVEIDTTVQQHLVNSGVALIGLDPYVTKLHYTGSNSDAQGILYVDGTTGTGSFDGGLIGFMIHGFYIYGNANATDALQMVSTHRSKVENVDLWGVTGACLHTLGAVTDTFSGVHCSVSDAFQNGLQGTTPTPATGKQFASFGGNQTTDGTVTDAIDEGVSGFGWYLQSASSMHFSAGTSELNLNGLVIAAGSKWNSFSSPDIEGNSANTNGVDIDDQGQGTVYIAPIAKSTCTGGCTATSIAGTGGGQVVISDSGLQAGVSGSFVILGNNPNFSAPEGATTLWNMNAVSVAAPIFTSDSGAPGLVPGTGITSATCADESGSAPACTSSRGTIKIINSSATTTSSFVQLTFHTPLASVPSCQIAQAGGTATNLGLFVSAVSTSIFDIANTASLSGVTTFYISYSCQL